MFVIHETFQERIKKEDYSAALAGLIGALESLTAGDKEEEFIMDILKDYIKAYDMAKEGK